MILSIESSCDDSSIALTNIGDFKLIKQLKISQEIEHQKYGGVVPELASRLHAVTLPKLLEEFKPYFDDIKCLAVTTHPGLSVSLHEGVIMAKSISAFLNVPIVGVNHLMGHIYSLFIEKSAKLPMIVLLVSGGHTMVLEVSSYKDTKLIATTLDDSVGEAYDKVAKMLNLGYPGGPIIEQMALRGDRNKYTFPVPLANSSAVAFSLSGLKNAVRLQIEKIGKDITESQKCDIAASFELAVVKHLKQKLKKIFKQNSIKDFAIVGGVSANRYINSQLNNLCKEFDKTLHQVDLQYTSDNAAMIGRWGVEAYVNKALQNYQELSVKPTKKLTIGEGIEL